MQNTVFCILAPDGKTKLIRAGRSPAWAFGGKRGPGIHEQPDDVINDMAKAMSAIAKRYPGKASGKQAQLAIPYLADVRLALNVTACDRQPLMVLYSQPKNS